MVSEVIAIKPEDILDKAEALKAEGYRMVQICATRVQEGFELSYSFDKDLAMKNLQFTIPLDGKVMSITSAYWPAFIYENEMHDLFGIDIRHIADGVDFHGHFFVTAKKTPWRELPPQKPAIKFTPEQLAAIAAAKAKKEAAAKAAAAGQTAAPAQNPEGGKQ